MPSREHSDHCTKDRYYQPHHEAPHDDDGERYEEDEKDLARLQMQMQTVHVHHPVIASVLVEASAVGCAYPQRRVRPGWAQQRGW